MNSTNTEHSPAELKFPLQLTTNKLDAGATIIEADLAEGTLALLGGSDVKISISNNDEYAAAADQLSRIKAASKSIEEQRKALTKPIDDEKKRVMDYVNPFTSALAKVENAYKVALIAYDDDQAKKRQLEEARIAEANRKEQEKLKARAEKAEEGGKVEKAEALREQAATTVFAVPAPPPTAAPLKVAGLSSRKVYTAEVINLKELVAAVAAGTVSIKAIQADNTFLNSMAAALKEEYAFPGTKLVIGTSMASRAKK